MIVEVLYFAEMEKITNNQKEIFELPCDKLKCLIDLLLKKYKGIREIIWDDKLNNLNNIVSVIINNQPLHGEKILTKKLNDKDKIAFLLPISGG